MKEYRVVFESFNQAANRFKTGGMFFEAEDEIHAINQLLDIYRDLEEHVACIESVIPMSRHEAR